jgi:diguanylate cyclase (GGDEF)-like protein
MKRFDVRQFLRLPVLVLALTLTAIGGVTLLETHADASRNAQLRVSSLNLALTDLIAAPYNADPTAGGPSAPAAARQEIRADEGILSRGLANTSGVEASSASLTAAHSDMARITATTAAIYSIAARPVGVDGDKRIPALQMSLAAHTGRLFAVLKRIDHADADRAHTARVEAAGGTALAMLTLVGVFMIFYVRSLRARRQNETLLSASRVEASTDALTGIGNRRALIENLTRAISTTEREPELLLAMFDLNGFKQYNDTFGHGAGDALLARLGARLAAVVDHAGSAYRMGGDEFCLLARCTPQAAEGLLAAAASALSDHGDGWSIDCSYGAAWIPSESTTASEALLTADQRMYANKATRSSASRQLTDVLLQVLNEQDKHLDTHAGCVAELAGQVARALGRPEHDVQRITLAAQLHDVGKTAIPGAILNKSGPLDEHEWEFVHRHTLVGERIVLAAPALAHTASLIRSSHERTDGTGYPDHLRGEQIPIGSRIIAVCDAFDAMTSPRPYRETKTPDAALKELTRCAGTQFDPDVVHAFCTILSPRQSPSHAPQITTPS